MSIHTFTGLNSQLASHGRAFNMGNLVHRRAAALAIQSVDGASFSNELISGLNQRPGTLTPELKEEFDRITEINPEFSDALVSSLESLLMREPAADGTVFVAPRGSMYEFLRASGIGPKEEFPKISEKAVRSWGDYEEQRTKSFREPRSLAVAQAVALHVDAVAIGEGSRVDPLEFAGHIYPELRVMLEEATQAGNEVYLKPPAFMAHIRFRDHTLQQFASGLANSGLAKRMGEDVGVAIDRLQTYVSDKSGKITPYVSTLRQIARAIAYDALEPENGEYAREVFRYLIFLRLRDFLTTEEGGKLRSLVPIQDEYGLPAIYTTSRNVVSRYTIVVKPDMRALHGSDEASRHTRRLRWIDRIMSDQYEKHISEWERRIASFNAFESVVVTRYNGKRADLRDLRGRLDNFRSQHSAYKSRLESAGGAHDALSHEEVAECVRFYGTFDRAFRHAIYFTHVRGTVARDGRSIPYEIVSQSSARSASRIPSGFVPVYGGDVFAQDWNVNRQEALVTLRAIRGYLARTRQLPDSETGFAEEVFSFYWPAHLAAHFRQAHADMRELGGQDLFNGRSGASLPLSQKRSQDTVSQPNFYLYDSGYSRAVPQDGETKLRAMVNNFYGRAGWDIFAQGDSWVVEQYLRAIRYPHYVYNADLLADLISSAHSTATAHAAASSRIETLFGAHSIKNEVAHQREQAGQRVVTARTLTEQAFADYRKYFSQSISHGLGLPVEEDLVRQIAQGLIVQHSSVSVTDQRVVQGVFDAISKYNRALCSDARRMPEYTLLNRGLFGSRFDRFVNAWQARSNERELPLDRRVLISAAQSLMSMATGVEEVLPTVVQQEIEMIAGDAKPAQIADAVSFVTSWLKRQRRDVSLMTRMMRDETYGIEAFMGNDGQFYRSPMIPSSDVAMLAVRAMRRRISMSGELDGRAEALDVLNDRFEFLPQVREQAATFMQAAAAHYLKWLRANLRIQLETMVEALELMGDGEHPIVGHNDFVRDLVEIADSNVPLDIFHSEYPSIRAVERVHRVAGELSNGNMPSALTVSDGVASVVRDNKAKAGEEQKEIDRLMAVIKSRVQRAQDAVARGRGEVEAVSREAADLLVSRAVRVADDISDLSSRIPQDDQARRSAPALQRLGRIAHHGATWVAAELDLNSGSLLRFVNNMQVHGVNSDVSPWRDRLSHVDDRLVSLGLGFEEARDAVKAEQDRRARAEADERAHSAIALAKTEVGRLSKLVMPETFVERFNGLMDRLDGVQSRNYDHKSFVASLTAYAADRQEARSVARFIDRRLVLIVNGIEIEHQPSVVVAKVRLVASEADTLRKQTNAAAQDVVEAWDKSKKDAATLTEMRDRIVQALGTARLRLENAECSLPPAVDIDMTDIRAVASRVHSLVARDDAQLYMAKKLTRKQATQAVDAMDGHARSTSVLSVNGHGYLVVMDDANQRSFDAWRDGGRKGDLMLASINGRDVLVPEGSRPVYTTPVRDLPKDHPLGGMARHFSVLKNNTPARAFVAWVDRYRRDEKADNKVIATQIWDQIIARLADPKLQTEDVPQAIADVAAAMRHDIRKIDNGLNWVDVVTQYAPVSRPLFADERVLLSTKGNAEIDANMISRVGGRNAVIRAMPSFVSAVEHGAMPSDRARQRLWRALIGGSKRQSGPIVRGVASAAAVWDIIARADREGHPYAGALRHLFLSRLTNIMFPRDAAPKPDSAAIDEYANTIARAVEHFYINLYAELEHWHLIHDASLGYGVERHGSVGGRVIDAMGLEEGALAHQMVSTIFQHNGYLPAGYALWSAFSNDARMPHVRDAIREVFARYGAYRLDETQPLSLHWMIEEVQNVLMVIERTGQARAELPGWWTTAPDEELLGVAPETAPVAWWGIHEATRPTSGNGRLAPIRNAAHGFVQLFPEFAGAVTIVESLRAAVGGKREYPFMRKIAELYSQAEFYAKAGTLDKFRDVIAADFRALYLRRHPFVQAALTSNRNGGKSLSMTLRVHDAIPPEVVDVADLGLATSKDFGSKAKPQQRPSE